MKKFFVSISMMLIFTILLCACGNNNQHTESVATAIAQTVEAMNQQTPQVIYVVVTPESTAASLPTSTILPSITPKTNQPTNTPQPCNKAVAISETVPDNTEIKVGTSFEKSWRLQNIGTCTWNADYRVAFYSGDHMKGPNLQTLGVNVAPGEIIDIIIDQTAPDSAGTYKGIWKLQDDSGVPFAQFWIQIKSIALTPCNKAAVVSETYPDGTEVHVGTDFDKSWHLQNIGTCTWNTNYRLVFDSGDQMGGPNSKLLNVTVAPGEIMDIIIDQTAPDSTGTYKGIWKLQDDSGVPFAQFWVQIKASN
ncbi:MAG: NBR1-Ig-like domain-containing protein [Anaerolineaceae bacterium]